MEGSGRAGPSSSSLSAPFGGKRPHKGPPRRPPPPPPVVLAPPPPGVIEPTSTFSGGQSTSKASKAGSKGGAKGLKRRDLNQFPPIKRFHVEEDHTRLYTVANGITDETLVVTWGQMTVSLYRLRVTEFKDEPKKPREIELIKVHQLEFENRFVGYFSVSGDISVTLPPNKLVYAVAPFGGNLVYYFHFSEKLPFPENINLDDVDLLEVYEDSIKVFDNGQPTTVMALKNDQYLACILANQLLVVWDIATETKLCSFLLSSEGVHLSWHPSEKFKLFVVETGGYIKYFNVTKERCYMVEYMCHIPLYSGDWSPSDPLLSVVGWAGGITCFNSSQSNTNMFKIHEQPCKVFKRVKFNPVDNRSIVTLERGFTQQGTIRLWRSHLPHCLWSFSSEQILDVDWMHGRSYLVGLGYKKIFVFDASTNS